MTLMRFGRRHCVAVNRKTVRVPVSSVSSCIRIGAAYFMEEGEDNGSFVIQNEQNGAFELQECTLFKNKKQRFLLSVSSVAF